LKPDFGHHPGRRHSFAGFPPGHPGGDHVPGDTHRPHFGGRFPLKRGFGFPPGGPHFPGGPGFGPFEEPSNEKKQQLIDAYKKCNGDFKEMVLEPPYKERFEKFTENAKERFAKMLEFQYNRAIKGQKRADSEPATSKDAHRKPVTEQKKND
jgi:hypothetical protein